MKIAFPIEKKNGLESLISNHFGQAPEFIIVDIQTREFQFIQNNKLSGEKSGCKSHFFSEYPDVTAIVTDCIGDGSIRNLNKAGIKVFKAKNESVQKNIDLFNSGSLSLFPIFDVCRDHKNKKDGQGCGHH